MYVELCKVEDVVRSPALLQRSWALNTDVATEFVLSTASWEEAYIRAVCPK